MIGLDTNVLVRLLVGDDPAQQQKAKDFVDAHCTQESPGFVNCMVLAELAWVLSRSYGYERADIAAVIEALLAGRDRIVEHHDEVRAGLIDSESNAFDLVDAIIARVNRARGCETTATFDRRAAKLDGFVQVG